MSVDPKIIEAVEIAVVKYGQDKSLATKIAAWLESMSAGNEDISDPQSTERHIKLLYGVTDEVKTNGTLL